MEDPVVEKNEVQCPHCGHFVGPVDRCAHCGQRLEKRMGLKGLRFSALVVAIVGLFLLHLYARNRELPLVEIGRISPVMNFSSVRIQGILESDARQLRSGSVLYVVDDGTGTIPVFCDKPEGRLPKAGSRITVSGNLSIGTGNEIRLRAHKAESVNVEATPVPEEYISALTLDDITTDQKGDRITVVGRVTRVWKPKAGAKAPFKIVLEDRSGALDVIHWLKEPPEVAVGADLEITGTVDVYREAVQLKVWSADDIQPLEKNKISSQAAISAITPQDDGRRLIVEGVLGAPRSIPGGVVYPLTDGAETVSLVLWDRNISGEERDALDEGVRVRIDAPVGLYKGKPQLVPVDVGGFQVLE